MNPVLKAYEEMATGKEKEEAIDYFVRRYTGLIANKLFTLYNQRIEDGFQGGVKCMD